MSFSFKRFDTIPPQIVSTYNYWSHQLTLKALSIRSPNKQRCQIYPFFRKCCHKQNCLSSPKFPQNFLIQYAECTQTKNINEILYRYALLLDSRDHLVDTTSRRQSTIVNCTKHFVRHFRLLVPIWEKLLFCVVRTISCKTGRANSWNSEKN